MSSVVKFSLRRFLNDKFIPNDLAKKLQGVIEDQIKPSIEKGVSPVMGKRLFAKYKNPKKYPGDLKQNNKPNLYLTGEMLSFYKARGVFRSQSATMGIHSDSPDDVLTKARANNFGTEAIKARPFIPSKEGMKFNRTVSNAIRQAIGETIKETLKRKR